MNNYEQKYKEALERAKYYYNNEETRVGMTPIELAEIFPELKESEDEKIRNFLIDYINHIDWGDWDFSRKQCIAWLENQKVQSDSNIKDYNSIDPHFGKPICNPEHWYVSKVDGQIHNMFYNPVNNVEPKFKVGDWIINRTNAIVMKIIDNKDFYESVEINGQRRTDTYNYVEWDFRLWNIDDAKDGDILIASDGSIFLFAGVVDCACKYYVALTTDNYVKINKETKSDYWETSRAVYPATKEQRDTFFTKMKEAGYKWNSEKKELINLFKN